MKKKSLRLYKAASLAILFAQLAYLAIAPYAADAVTMPSASYVTMGTTEDLLAEIQRQQDAGLTDDQVRDQSTANRKINGPQVKVQFDKQNVQSGGEVTAEALASGFTKGSEGLYFTWFLKHKGCDLGDDVDTGSYCDPDGDGEVTENDWKVEAMKILAKGDFDSAGASYSGDKSSTEEKADGFEAYFGNETANGDDEDEAACYFQDYSSGRFFELNAIEAGFDCEEGYYPQCVEDAEPKISCTYDNPYFDALLPESATNSRTVSEEKSVCQAQTDNASLKADLGSSSQEPVCKFNNPDDIDIYKLSVSCDGYSNKKAVCVKKDNFTGVGSSGNFFAKSMPNSAICSSLGLSTDGGSLGSSCSSLFSALDNSSSAAKQSNTADPNASVSASCSFSKGAGTCKHLFPEPSKGKTGDGKFTMEEEKFWGTDPNGVKTSGNQNVDEANVAGLGMNKFTWEYRTGDKLGVVVEGTFTKETQHANGSKMVMWALPNNVCSAFEKEAVDKSKTGFYAEGTKNILAVDFDIDKCLEENLLDPGGNGKLQVDLTYNPSDNLINDPEGGDYGAGTLLSAVANVSGFSQEKGGTVSLNSFYYNWKIEVSNSSIVPPLNTDPWIDVTSKVKKANPDLRLEGVGKRELELPLNLPSDIFVKGEDPVQYIRLKAEVEQLQDGGVGLFGKGTAIIKINQLDSGKSIKMFPVSAQSDGRLNLLDNRKELCSDQSGKYVCYVTENEIVGLTVSKSKISGPYSWAVNGNQASCDSGMSSQCADGNILFFPARASEEGDGMIKVTLVARDSESQSGVTLERYFQITDPAVAIASADFNSVQPKLFGFYKNPDGTRTPDYSTNVYEAAGNAPVKLKALFYPAWKGDQASLEWYVNGMPSEQWRDKEEIEIDPSGMSEINVDLSVNYNPGAENQIDNIRKALWNHWRLSPIETAESSGEASVRIEIAGGGEAVASGPKKWMGAMLSSHVASEAVFVIRLFLTTLLIIFVMGMVFALIPENDPAKERL